jgi:hypothetical protein
VLLKPFPVFRKHMLLFLQKRLHFVQVLPYIIPTKQQLIVPPCFREDVSFNFSQSEIRTAYDYHVFGLSQMNLNLVGNICGRSSTTTFHKFIPIGQRRG